VKQGCPAALRIGLEGVSQLSYILNCLWKVVWDGKGGKSSEGDGRGDREEENDEENRVVGR
jgi:hypothetical protein